MRLLWGIFACLLCIPPAIGQAGTEPQMRTWYLPALGYGPTAWSIVRITNSSAFARSAHIEVFREQGEPLPFEPEITVPGRSSRDIRIEKPGSSDELCWVRISEPDEYLPPLEVKGFLEILRGNTIEDFNRGPHAASSRDRWVSRSANVQGRELYFLNVASKPTTVSVCAVNQPNEECRKRGSAATHYMVAANQSISLQIRKLRQRFLAIESAAPGAAILVLFTDGPGTKKVFGSDSSIHFGDALP